MIWLFLSYSVASLDDRYLLLCACQPLLGKKKKTFENIFFCCNYVLSLTPNVCIPLCMGKYLCFSFSVFFGCDCWHSRRPKWHINGDVDNVKKSPIIRENGRNGSREFSTFDIKYWRFIVYKYLIDKWNSLRKNRPERLDMIEKSQPPRLECVWITRKLRDKMCKAKIFNANNLFGEWMFLYAEKKEIESVNLSNGRTSKGQSHFFPSSSFFISLNFKMAFTLRNGQLCFYVCFNQVLRCANEAEKRKKNRLFKCR